MRSISRATGRERWMLVKSTPVRDERGAVTMAVNIMEDVTEARRAERQQRFLASASKLVSASLDVEETVRHLADAIVPEIGDWCIVDMPDDRGVPRPVTVAHADDDRRALLAEMRERHPPGDHDAGPAGVMRHGRPQLFEHVDETTVAGYAAGERHFELMRELGTRSLAVVPLSAGDRALGAITVGTAESGRRLTEVDLALLAEVGRRAGIAVENARVHEARTRIAVTLQRSLLPPRLPIVPGLTIAARFRAAGITSEVGGDFYDLFPAGDAWMVVIGDVTGKGPEAAAITSLARYTMRTASVYESSPAAVLHRLNEALAADPERRRLCTVLCLRLERDGDGPLRGTLAAGGHPLPFLVGPDGAAPVGRPGPLLGAFEGSHWRESAVDLPEGTSLVLYTDGVTDTRGLDGRFGDARLASVLASARGLDADEVASRIDAALLDFQQGPQPDDVALLVLRSGRPPDARGNGGMPAGPARG
jgi:serine phosphatase RsbU (regulator of sigma subunit)